MRRHLANDPKQIRRWALFYECWYTGIVCWMPGMTDRDCIPRHHTVVASRPGRMVWNGNALAGMGWNTSTGFMVKINDHWAMQASIVHGCIDALSTGVMADIDWIDKSVAVLQWKHPVSRSSLWRTWRLGTSWKPGWTAEQGSKPTIPNNDRGFTENKINAPIRQAWNINTAAILGHLENYETHPVIHLNTKKYYWLQHSSKCSYVTSYVTFIPIIRVKLHQWIRHVPSFEGNMPNPYMNMLCCMPLSEEETFSGVASPLQVEVEGEKSLNCIALHCIALHCIALHCTALHCTALHCTALHYITLHYITLHYITLHYYVISYANYTYSNQWCINKIFQVLRMRA